MFWDIRFNQAASTFCHTDSWTPCFAIYAKCWLKYFNAIVILLFSRRAAYLTEGLNSGDFTTKKINALLYWSQSLGNLHSAIIDAGFMTGIHECD